MEAKGPFILGQVPVLTWWKRISWSAQLQKCVCIWSLVPSGGSLGTVKCTTLTEFAFL